MWLILLIASGIFLLANILKMSKGENASLYRFLSMALLSLSLCSVYAINASWVISEDWTALLDVSETMSKYVWIISISLILLNSISLFKEIRKRKKD